jgi:hypothetical protein
MCTDCAYLRLPHSHYAPDLMFTQVSSGLVVVPYKAVAGWDGDVAMGIHTRSAFLHN